MRFRLPAALTVATAVVVLTTLSPAAQAPPLPLRITAWAVNMSNIGAGQTNTVDVVINRWSSDAEREGLITAFREKGPDKLLDALQDQKPVGTIRLPTSLGYDLRFARHFPLDEGGQRFILLTDRPIGFAEARNQPRTVDYPFTLIEIRVGKDGTGVGKLSYATKISYNKKDQVVELENYATEPIRLQNVRIESNKG